MTERDYLDLEQPREPTGSERKAAVRLKLNIIVI